MQDLKISNTLDYFLKHNYIKILRKRKIITIQIALYRQQQIRYSSWRDSEQQKSSRLIPIESIKNKHTKNIYNIHLFEKGSN